MAAGRSKHARRELLDEQTVNGAEQKLGVGAGLFGPGALEQLAEGEQVDLVPARRDRLHPRPARGLQQQPVGGDERAAPCSKPSSSGSAMTATAASSAASADTSSWPDARRLAAGVRVALGGEVERRGEQVFLGLEVVGRRGEWQTGHLGHAAVGHSVGPHLGDDPQHRLEQGLAPRGAAHPRRSASRTSRAGALAATPAPSRSRGCP